MHTSRTLMALAIALLSSGAIGQPPRGYFWWSASVDGARVNPDAAWPTYILNGPKDVIELAWTFKNDEGVDTVSVVPAALEAGIRVLVQSDRRTVATALAWAADGTWFSQANPVAVRSQDTVQLQPGDRLEWRLSLRRRDGAAWGTGRYECALDIGAAAAALRHGERPWAARMDREGRLTFLIDDGATVQARKAEHVVRASRALADGRPLVAVEHYRMLLQEDPKDESGYAGLGLALFAARQYREAVVPLERALPAAVSEKSAIPDTLAFAYLALGEESHAVRVLRMVTPESQLPARLERLKASLRSSRR